MIHRRKVKRPKAIWVQIRDRLNPNTNPESARASNSSGYGASASSTRPDNMARTVSRNTKGRARWMKRKSVTKRLRIVSKKKSCELRLYSFLKGCFAAARGMSPGRSNGKSASFDIHHSRGRISTLLLDVRYWRIVSREEHNWIQANPQAAREAGLLCQPGEWNRPPDDEITRELRQIMQCARNGRFAEAKENLAHLMRSNGLLAIP